MSSGFSAPDHGLLKWLYSIYLCGRCVETVDKSVIFYNKKLIYTKIDDFPRIHADAAEDYRQPSASSVITRITKEKIFTMANLTPLGKVLCGFIQSFQKLGR